MSKHLSIILFVAAAMLCAWPAVAQHKRLSPHETISGVVNGNRVTITYGRPYTIKHGTTKVRKIWGGLVPYGKPWRMGADEATLLITQQPIEMGGKTIPAGAYTLYMMPEENGASQLVFSTDIGKWGIPVDTAHDLVRVDLKKGSLDTPVHQYTMAIARSPAGGGVLKMMWEKTEFTVPFTVKK